MNDIPELVTVEEAGQWYILGPWDKPCGPYKTKADAEEIRRGLLRTYKYHNEIGFITVC